MRVLILSANTGGGHNSTAEALSRRLELSNIEYEIADTLAFISEQVSDFISWGHSYIYRKMPGLFGFGYRFEEKHSGRILYGGCAKGADALYERLQEGGFDAVLCVHVFSGLMMTEVRVKHGCNIPCYFIATDYTCSPGVSDMKLDGYFIPHRMLLGEFVHKGVPADKLFPVGIPVGDVFFEEGDKMEARRKLGLPEDKRIVLLSCGSMGCGKLEKSARFLSQRCPKDVCLVVLCGKNEKAYEILSPFASDRFVVLSFIRGVADYMTAADAYVTKPGGLTTTEAVAKRLPMVLINAVPGCETRNYDFLVGQGVACGARRWRHVNAALLRLLTDASAMEEQKQKMEAFMSQPATDAICRQLLYTHT
ncbi:MAG: hypothetical protein IJX28_08175 [Clostridia bacterium]|nr:hypothetical protein [Clostridia bacterium]